MFRLVLNYKKIYNIMDLQEEEKISTKKYEEPLKRISDSSINTLKKQAEKYKIKSNECLQRFRDDYNSKINCVLTYEEQFKHKHDLQMKQIDNYRIEFDYCLTLPPRKKKKKFSTKKRSTF